MLALALARARARRVVSAPTHPRHPISPPTSGIKSSTTASSTTTPRCGSPRSVSPASCRRSPRWPRSRPPAIRKTAYETQIHTYLASPKFTRQMFHFWQDTLKLGDDPDFDSAPRSPREVTVDNRPFTDVVHGDDGHVPDVRSRRPARSRRRTARTACRSTPVCSRTPGMNRCSSQLRLPPRALGPRDVRVHRVPRRDLDGRARTSAA